MSQPRAKRERASPTPQVSHPQSDSAVDRDIKDHVCALLKAYTDVGAQRMHGCLACALIAPPGVRLDASVRCQFASRFAAAIVQLRMRDPFACLPDDVVQLVLCFLDPLRIAELRRVSRRWRDAGNVALSRSRYLDIGCLVYRPHASSPDLLRNGYAIHFAATRCRGVEIVRVDVGQNEFSELEVVRLLMAIPNVKALMIRPPSSALPPPIIDVKALRGLRPCCSGLRVLTIGELGLASYPISNALHLVPTRVLCFISA